MIGTYNFSFTQIVFKTRIKIKEFQIKHFREFVTSLCDLKS